MLTNFMSFAPLWLVLLAIWAAAFGVAISTARLLYLSVVAYGEEYAEEHYR